MATKKEDTARSEPKDEKFKCSVCSAVIDTEATAFFVCPGYCCDAVTCSGCIKKFLDDIVDSEDSNEDEPCEFCYEENLTLMACSQCGFGMCADCAYGEMKKIDRHLKRTKKEKEKK